ncbi:MAG: glycosyltransferase family 4 protein [Isosphaeraceae bacterium]|nr:glycosyltransferase family 4 protein [Isosphaeraceae bacterium]
MTSMLTSDRSESTRESAPPAARADVLVACPDARPPAYQAAAALAAAGRLASFVTSIYYDENGPIARLLRRFVPHRFERIRRILERRRDPAIPTARVIRSPAFDLSLQLEIRMPRGWAGLRRMLALRRVDRFDRRLARIVERVRPSTLLVFSDVGSRRTLPLCRALGIRTVVSMVTGEVGEEREILERQERLEPAWFPIYLGSGTIDRDEIAMLHERRRLDAALADRILVPSEHIKNRLIDSGTPAERIRVVPYAADTSRFRPAERPAIAGECTFLFAGGIAQRKGIKYLLDAWDRIARPGLRLQLLGGLPLDPGPLAGRLERVELLGRVGHEEVAARMSQADIFVFPSLFEGSAVVTYEAMACGLPLVTTPNAGSIARDGVEALIVPAGDVDRLAEAMLRLADDLPLRLRMARAARSRALAFDWSRHHDDLLAQIRELDPEAEA